MNNNPPNTVLTRLNPAFAILRFPTSGSSVITGVGEITIGVGEGLTETPGLAVGEGVGVGVGLAEGVLAAASSG